MPADSLTRAVRSGFERGFDWFAGVTGVLVVCLMIVELFVLVASGVIHPYPTIDRIEPWLRAVAVASLEYRLFLWLVLIHHILAVVVAYALYRHTRRFGAAMTAGFLSVVLGVGLLTISFGVLLSTVDVAVAYSEASTQATADNMKAVAIASGRLAITTSMTGAILSLGIGLPLLSAGISRLESFDDRIGRFGILVGLFIWPSVIAMAAIQVIWLLWIGLGGTAIWLVAVSVTLIRHPPQRI